MTGFAAAAATAAAVLGCLLVWSRFWPYQPCPRCKGRRGRSPGSTAEAYGRCRACGNSGERVRPLSRIWAKHRAEAARAKEKRKSR